MTLVFIDANVFIYTAGRPHPLKAPCGRVIDLVSKHPDAFFTDAEVFQETLHRYIAVRLWPLMRDVFVESAALMTGRIEPLLPADVERAASLADRYPVLSARDLVHWAVMQRVGAARIVTADGNFGGLPGIERLDPMLVDEWRETVVSEN
jgi:predicted nucleic acid-binding protein